MSLLNPAGEEWFHRNGLGSCYPTYLSLATGFSDEIEIAAHQHQHQKTVRRHLVRLQEVGLAHRKENGAWTIPESVPDDLSATVGTAGKAATLKARHNQERENYQRVQAQLQDRAQSEWEAIRGWGSWLYGEWPEEMPEALRRTR